MFTTFADTGADGLWRQMYAAVSDDRVTQANPCRGGSQELLHVAFSISEPRLRWVLSRTPPINPAFALAEVVWIMQGRDDSAFLVPWNSALPRFAGQAQHLHGAYGHRLRTARGLDQLKRAAEVLAVQPGHRQVVLQIWDSAVDAPGPDGTPSDRDIPCNVGSQLKIADGRLDWLQLVRSNDIMLGLPYNIVQWTTVQEVIAGWLDIPVGEYHQVSDSLHLYDRDRDAFRCANDPPRPAAVTSLALGFEASSRVFASLESLILRLNATDHIPQDAFALVEDELPPPYSDWQYVLIAEMLRRKRRPLDAIQAANLILDQQLHAAMKHWFGRFSEDSWST